MNHLRISTPLANPGVPAIVTFAARPVTASVGAQAVGAVEPAPPAPDDDPPEEWDEEVLEDLPEEEQTPVTPT